MVYDIINLIQISAIAAKKPSGTQQFMMMMPMFGIMIVILYLFIWKPQQKKQKEHDNMLGAMQKGDKVITVGGLHGTLIGVKEDIAVIKVSENVKLEINKSAISTIVKKK
ncbi:MAG: preprotein translocase subunit YajC [Candidatus Aureabacteria bacterium]|nr:preprotein translocase subunit YajC [Candidatus Auribacterota bacterium]